jgi:hypothetical protein
MFDMARRFSDANDLARARRQELRDEIDRARTYVDAAQGRLDEADNDIREYLGSARALWDELRETRDAATALQALLRMPFMREVVDSKRHMQAERDRLLVTSNLSTSRSLRAAAALRGPGPGIGAMGADGADGVGGAGAGGAVGAPPGRDLSWLRGDLV